VDIEGLPGAEFITTGIRDLSLGRTTVEALLVAIGAERMRRAGLDVPLAAIDEPEIRLYQLLAEPGRTVRTRATTL
jgi:hypothetical protein